MFGTKLCSNGKCIAIFGTSLEEYFMIRVAALKQ
jgi:polyphosphate kinase